MSIGCVETGNRVLDDPVGGLDDFEIVLDADLGPGGGNAGGHIVGTGTPEDVASSDESYTGQYLRPYLARRPAQRRRAG